MADFGFAFNDVNFSDRTLRIVILPDDHHDHKPSYSSGSKPAMLTNSSQSWGSYRKRSLHHPHPDQRKNKYCYSVCNGAGLEYDHHHKPSYSSGSKPAMPTNTNSIQSCGSYRKRRLHHPHPDQRKKKYYDSVCNGAGLEYNNTDDHVVFEKLFGVEIATNQPAATDHEKIGTSKLLHVSSLILAGHSMFFRKMFTNGMKESHQQLQHAATIHIQASEEDAFMDLLKFMYTGTLSSTSPSALWDVLMAADKFDVPSCIMLCTQLLMDLPMTLEVASLYVQLRDSTCSMLDYIRPLEDSVKKFLVEHFKNMDSAEVQEELLQLPSVGVVEVVLSSDCLQIKSEDRIYDFIVKWVQMHYSNQSEERLKMLNMLVGRYLRFPFISSAKMKDILTCRDIYPEIASEFAVGALRYHQNQPPAQQQADHDPIDKFVKRAYLRRPLKVVAFDSSSSHPQCILYLDIKRDECKNMFSHDDIDMVFQPFFLGKHMLAVYGMVPEVEDEHGDRYHTFGLGFCTWSEEHDGPHASEASGLSVHFEIAAIKKLDEKFETLIDETMIMPEDGDFTGIPLCHGSWEDFISEVSPYFVNDILRLRCHLTVTD